MSPPVSQLPQLTSSPRFASEGPAVPRNGPEAATRAEAASVAAQLRLIQAAMHEERALRLTQTTLANIQLADMRRALEVATEERSPEPHREGWFLTRAALPPLIAAVLVLLVGVLLFHPEWLGGLLHPWIADPQATQQPMTGSPRDAWSKMESVQEFARPGPPSAESLAESSSATYELARLNGALDAIPVTAVPTIMGSVNQWLWALGGPPCSVESSRGEVSLVISARGQAHPLLTALSRCADAVEHFTQP